MATWGSHQNRRRDETWGKNSGSPCWLMRLLGDLRNKLVQQVEGRFNLLNGDGQRRADPQDAAGERSQKVNAVAACLAAVTSLDDPIGDVVGRVGTERATFDSEHHAFAPH